MCSFLIVLTVGAVIFLGAVLLKATFDLADSFLMEQDGTGGVGGVDAGAGAEPGMDGAVDVDASSLFGGYRARRLRGFGD